MTAEKDADGFELKDSETASLLRRALNLLKRSPRSVVAITLVVIDGAEGPYVLVREGNRIRKAADTQEARLEIADKIVAAFTGCLYHSLGVTMRSQKDVLQ